MYKAEARGQASKQAKHAGILGGCRRAPHLMGVLRVRKEARETLPNGRVEDRR